MYLEIFGFLYIFGTRLGIIRAICIFFGCLHGLQSGDCRGVHTCLNKSSFDNLFSDI